MPNVQSVSFTSPGYDYAADQAEILRRQQLAQALQEQSMQPLATNRMVGRTAIPINPLEGAAQIAQGAASAYETKSAQDKQRELADRYQTDYRSMVAKGLRELQGSQATEDPAGNYIAAQQADPAAAMATFGSHPAGAALMPLAMQRFTNQERQRMLADILRGGGAGGAQGMPGQAPQGAAGGFGAGIPPQVMALMTSGDPELAALGKAILDTKKITALRPGAPGVDQLGNVVAQPTPSTPPGVGLTLHPGQLPQAYAVPGAMQAMAATTQAQAAAGEAGKAPYRLGTYNTEGAPSVMTDQQAIEAATGRPMPQPWQIVPQLPQGQALQTTAPSESAAMQQFATGGGQPRTVQIMPPQRPGLRLQDQGAGAEQREVGKGLGEYTMKTQETAANAAVSNRYLDNMELAAKDIRLGKLAPAQSSLIQWGQALGLPISEESKNAAGSIQALTSMAIKMAGQATRQSDAQPSQLQYLKILESMPKESRTEDGFRKIVAYLRDSNNYSIAKMQALQNWRRAHNGTAEGFEAQWPEQAKQLPFVWNQVTGGVPGSAPDDPLGIRRK